MGRTPCCTKVGLQRGPWTAREDTLLRKYIEKHGEGNWRMVPKSAGILRCGKSCRLRWMNYLRPNIKRGNIGADEEDLIIKLHALLGNRWSLIAGRLPGRTDNEIKNYWNTHLSKSLKGRGIDPTTHRPFRLSPRGNPADPCKQQIDAEMGSKLPQRNTGKVLHPPKAIRASPLAFFPALQSTTGLKQTEQEVGGSSSPMAPLPLSAMDYPPMETDLEHRPSSPPIEIKDDDQVISTKHPLLCELSSWADVQNWLLDDPNYNYIPEKNIMYPDFVDEANYTMPEENVGASSGINCPLGGQEPVFFDGDLDWDI